jgi:hypothetical protein
VRKQIQCLQKSLTPLITSLRSQNSPALLGSGKTGPQLAQDQFPNQPQGCVELPRHSLLSIPTLLQARVCSCCFTTDVQVADVLLARVRPHGLRKALPILNKCSVAETQETALQWTGGERLEFGSPLPLKDEPGTHPQAGKSQG